MAKRGVEYGHKNSGHKAKGPKAYGMQCFIGRKLCIHLFSHIDLLPTLCCCFFLLGTLFYPPSEAKYFSFSEK